MAEFTFGAILSPMQIGMAILAFGRNVREIEILVAIATFHYRVTTMSGKLVWA